MNPLVYLFIAYLVFLSVFYIFLFRLLGKTNRLEAKLRSMYKPD